MILKMMENGVLFLNVKFVSFVPPSPVTKSIVRLLRDEWNQNPHSITQLHVCLLDAKKKITQLHVFLLDAAFISLEHQTGIIRILFCSRRLNFFL